MSRIIISLVPRNAGRSESPSLGVTPAKTGRVVIVSVDLAPEGGTRRNEHTVPIDLSGWTLLSTVGSQKYSFPTDTVLNLGETI